MKDYNSFAFTVIGGSHIKQGKECQDYSGKYENANIIIAAVADGHGDDNCFRSAKGAYFVIVYAIEGINEFFKLHESKFSLGFFKKPDKSMQDNFKNVLKDLVKHIIAKWQIKVEEDYNNNPFCKDELDKTDDKHRKRFESGNELYKAYGSTLLTCAITKHYWFGLHIGDGRLTALYPDGSYDQPIPWDNKCNLNVTTSICDDDALERTRFYFSFSANKPPPLAVFICTDGIDDNYPVEGNDKHLFKLYRTITLTFAEEGYESTCNQLKDLANEFATKGKGDDTSIAGFINMEGLKKAVPIWKKQIEEEKTVETRASCKSRLLLH